jgi:hypothetical protein
MLMLHIKDAAKYREQSQVMYKMRIENRSLLQWNIRSTYQFFLNSWYVSEIVKCLSVATLD